MIWFFLAQAASKAPDEIEDIRPPIPGPPALWVVILLAILALARDSLHTFFGPIRNQDLSNHRSRKKWPEDAWKKRKQEFRLIAPTISALKFRTFSEAL